MFPSHEGMSHWVPLKEIGNGMRDVFILWYSVTLVYNTHLVFFSPPDAVPFKDLNFLKINKSVDLSCCAFVKWLKKFFVLNTFAKSKNGGGYQA